MSAGAFSLLPTQTRRLLVVETDGFRLRAAVVRARGEEVAVEHVAESHAFEAAEAFAEVVARLRPHGLPRSALLLVPEAVSAVLELPVDPAQPRPPAQMKEMIRWELDAHLAAQPSSRAIEEILVGRGYLTWDDVRRVRAAQESESFNRNSAGSVQAGGSRLNELARSGNRFAELAVEMRLVRQGQLDECLGIQSQMQAKGNDECICGWTAVGGKTSNGEGQYRWLACGVGQGVRRRWSSAFQAAGLDLLAIYPLVGTSAAALSGQVVSRAATVLEIQLGIVCVTRLVDGQVRSVGVQFMAGRPLSAELCLGMLGAEPLEEVWLAGRVAEVPDLAEQLSVRLGRAVKSIPVVLTGALPTGIARESLAPTVGAAAHALLRGIDRAASVPARDAGPPMWRRIGVQATAATCAMLLVLILLEASTAWQLRQVLVESERVVALRDQVLEAKQQVDAQIQRIEQLRAPLQEAQAELVQVQRRREFLDTRLPASSRFLPELLVALADAANEEVVVDAITKREAQEVHIAGWSLSENSAQQFVRKLAAALPRWELTIAEVRVWDQAGRLGLSGYAIDLRFAPLGAELAPTSGAGRSSPATGRQGNLASPAEEL